MTPDKRRARSNWPIYSQQRIGGSTVDFRNNNDEPWVSYKVKIGQDVIMMAPDYSGYQPWPELERVEPHAG